MKAENERLREASRPTEGLEEMKKQIEEFKQKSSKDQDALKKLEETEELAKKNFEEAEVKINELNSELEALQSRQNAGEEAEKTNLNR